MSKKAKAKTIIKLGIKSAIEPRKTKKTLEDILESRKVARARHQKYQEWFNGQTLSSAELQKQKDAAKKLDKQPLISVIVPTYNTNEKYFRECLDSVIDQTYKNWELCIADDASTEPIIEVAKEYEKKYGSKKIKWTRLENNMHISGASNEALKLAKGEFIALLDHDDILMPNALYEVVKVINQNPKADFIYSDEDKIEEGIGHLEPFFKPDWSPDFLRSCNYITHFSVLRRSLVEKIGGFNLGTEGAQDWDLFLRITKETKDIFHVSKIIYSWRKSETSTAKKADSKPYAYLKQRTVLRNATNNGKVSTSVINSPSMGFWRTQYQITGNPKVSIIIPTKDNYKLIKKCVMSIIDKTSYANFEIIIVDSGTTSQRVKEFYGSREIKANDIKIVNLNSKEFNFSGACNFGVKHSNGEYLLFLNNDTEVINPDWIEGLLEHAQRDEVGMVGCKLYFPDDTIQHAGVVLSYRDIAFHPFYGLNPSHDLFTHIYIENIRNCSAVTAACSMVSKQKFNQVGGFDESLKITYNDIDLCLRLLKSGYNNVYTPYSMLYHYESMSVGRVTAEDRDREELETATAIMRKRWGKYIKRDPYYNDNFENHGPGYQLKTYARAQ